MSTDPKSTNNYRDLLVSLARINADLIDSANSRFFDVVNESYSGNFFKNTQPLYEAKVIEKDEHLGVVVSIPSDPREDFIYVDVPKQSIEGIAHADQYAGVDIPADSGLSHKKFYYISKLVKEQDRPAVGAVVRVKVAKNYFNQAFSNPLDNKYLGTYNGDITLFPASKYAQQSQAALAMTKEQYRDSLAKFKPKNFNQSDVGRLPYNENYTIISLPSPRIRPNYGTFQQHYALDIGMPVGTPVVASTAQTVVGSFIDPDGFGNYVQTRDDNGKYLYYYAHLSSTLVAKGQKLKAGDKIGLSGQSGNITGPHLHYEIRDETGRKEAKVNPLFLTRGTIRVSTEMKERFGFDTDTLSLPFPLESNSFDPVSVSSEEDAPVPQVAINQSRSSSGVSKSPPRNRPRMILQNIEVDQSYGSRETFKKGSTTIKVREDIIGDIKQIKNILNNYNIPLTCQAININLDLNNKISLLSRVGLEIQLNQYAGFVDYRNDDFLIGPDLSKPSGNGYSLRVYGRVRRNLLNLDIKQKPENKIISIYDTSGEQLKTMQIRENVLDITQLFEDYGFMAVSPRQEFFLSNTKEKSNWYIFQKPSLIKKDYTYKELLSTVHIDNGEPIWKIPEMRWDGMRFI